MTDEQYEAAVLGSSGMPRLTDSRKDDGRAGREKGASQPPPEPFTAGDLKGAFWRPHRMIEVVLSARKRLAASIADGDHVGLLVALLLVVSLTAALPYGAVVGLDRFWRVAAMFLGSVLICFPSLHIFGAFLGFRSKIGQNLGLALLISAVASLFTLGFAPILWFLSATMQGKASVQTVHGISVALLITGLVAGLVQLGRCLHGEERLRSGRADWLLIIVWQVLLIFITCRMGIYLGLL